MSNQQQPETARPDGAPALHGIRVVDLTHHEAGTSCTQFLAWMGAEVIKVEEPTKGDAGRAGPNESNVDTHYFLMLNANKRSLTLNLKDDEGRAILRTLIEKSDVFVENFSPGTIERMGFGWDAVRAMNPRIVYAQIKGFAPGSPHAGFLGYDAVAQSAGGALSTTGEADGRPIRPGFHIGDTGTGIHCTMGILGALYQRHFTGRGQRVVVAMQEAVMNYGRAAFAAGVREGHASHRHGNGNTGGSVPCDLFRCKGGGPNDYCFIYCRDDRQWGRLLGVIERNELEDDPRFATRDARKRHRDEVDELITAWTSRYDKQVVMQKLGAARVAASAVLDTKDLLEDPYLRESGAVVTVRHPSRGEISMPGWPVRMSDSSVQIEPSPLFGADTDEVLTEIVGLGADKVAELRENKVV